MADRNLPLGQITPVARPIGAFVQAAQAQPAAPARPVQLDNPSGISTIQIGARGNVAGFNQYEQLHNAYIATRSLIPKVPRVPDPYILNPK